jgi:transposase
MSEIDYKHVSQVVCPYCGHKHGDGWTIEEMGREEAEIQCDSCGKEFTFWLNIEVTYSSEPKEDE